MSVPMVPHREGGVLIKRLMPARVGCRSLNRVTRSWQPIFSERGQTTIYAGPRVPAARRTRRPSLHNVRFLLGVHRCVHAVEGVDAFFLLRAEAPALVAARAQVLLHGFADSDVLVLNLVAEADGIFGGSAS